MPEQEEDEESLKKIIADVEADYEADIYLYSAGIDHEGYGKIVKDFKRNHKNALLILTTNGGLANSAFQIARFFQNQYEEFLICIPSVCKSAGTLLAIGASRLIMGPFSELGPLDVQLYERDEIFSRKSGLLSHSAFDALKQESFALYEHFLLSIKARSGDNISFPVASSVAGEMAAGLMAPIFEQISPNVLGSDYRDLQVAIHYGERLAAYSGNISSGGVRFLTENYPSHDFIIDKQEADELFEKVDEPTQSLWKLIGTFSGFVLSEKQEGFVFRLSSFTESSTEEGDQDTTAMEAQNEDQQNGDEERPTEVDNSPRKNRASDRKSRKERAGQPEGGKTVEVQGLGGDQAPSN